MMSEAQSSADSIALDAQQTSMFTPASSKPEVVTLRSLIEAYLQEYEVRQFRHASSRLSARPERGRILPGAPKS
jgi:hypothetical protein